MTYSSTFVLESQIDWLTMTCSAERAVTRWMLRSTSLIHNEQAEGNRSVPWRLGRYDGQRCGRVRVGTSDRGIMIQLSGELAAAQFDYLWKDHTTFTRLDIAVTYKTETYDSEQAALAYAQASVQHSDRPRSALPSIVRDANGGSTCYLGRRVSDRFCRLYNKYAESLASGDTDAATRYVNCWRVELELKDVAATAVGIALAQPGSKARLITHYLHHYLTQHGITPPFPDDASTALPHGFRRRSDRDSRLEWLRRSVRPTIDWLSSSCSVEELRDILGLES